MNSLQALEHIRFWSRYSPDENGLRAAALLERASREFASPWGAGYFVEPVPGTVWGVDTSHWDGNVNFEVTRALGGSFAFIKCMDGTVETRYFKANLARALTAGLLASGYQWLYPDKVVSAKLQAQRVHELTKNLGMTLPLVIDFEWTKYNGQPANPNYDDLRKWTLEYVRLSGRKPILYSAAGYMNLFGKMPLDLREMFEAFWWASYGGSQPIYPMGFNYWDAWQFSANGDALTVAPGDTGKKELDLNYMKPELFKKFGGGLVTPPPNGGTNMKYKVTWDGGVARRTRPSTSDSATSLPAIPDNTVVEVLQDNIPDADDPTNPLKKWVKFVETLNGAPLYGASDYPRNDGTAAPRMEKVIETPPPSDKTLTFKVDGFKPVTVTLQPE